MSERVKDNVLKGILICLIIIALKPVPQMSVNQTPANDLSLGESVVQISPNRIGIVDTRGNSGFHGNILVFDYDEKNRTFKYTGNFNYNDYFRNPQKYGIPVQ